MFISAYGTLDGTTPYPFHSMRFVACSLRYRGKYCANIDYANAVGFIGCKGEYQPSGTGFFNTTSNTGSCGRIQDSISSTNVSVNDVDLGRDTYIMNDPDAALLY